MLEGCADKFVGQDKPSLGEVRQRPGAGIQEGQMHWDPLQDGGGTGLSQPSAPSDSSKPPPKGPVLAQQFLP